MTYKVAEKFKSIQGEGVYAGTPMAFIRFVGCSVGKRICQHCDTDFDETYEYRGGGEFSMNDLANWAAPYIHFCLTGGEPFDQDLESVLMRLAAPAYDMGEKWMVHIETSGTKPIPTFINEAVLKNGDSLRSRVWICVSPKPGFREDVVQAADEVKVIIPGLGEVTPKLLSVIGKAPYVVDEKNNSNLRWPGIADAVRWAEMGKTVFLQPRNGKYDVDKNNLMIVQDILRDHPELRLSVQMHKILRVQ